jgi:hypothetical protein
VIDGTVAPWSRCECKGGGRGEWGTGNWTSWVCRYFRLECVGDVRGYTRRAAIRPNKHRRTGKRSQYFHVRMQGSERGCALLRANPLDLPPRDFLKWAEPEVFGLQSVQESGWAVNFIRKLPRPILKTEIVQRTESAYWVLSQRALCSPRNDVFGLICSQQKHQRIANLEKVTQRCWAQPQNQSRMALIRIC